MMCNSVNAAMRVLERQLKPTHPLKDRIVDSQYRFDNGAGRLPIEYKKYAEGTRPVHNLKQIRPEAVKEVTVRPEPRNRRWRKPKPKVDSSRSNLQRTVTGVPILTTGKFEDVYGGLDQEFFPEEMKPLISDWYVTMMDEKDVATIVYAKKERNGTFMVLGVPEAATYTLFFSYEGEIKRRRIEAVPEDNTVRLSGSKSVFQSLSALVYFYR